MAKGISTRGDVLVNVTSDGVDLNQSGPKYKTFLELYNANVARSCSCSPTQTTLVADAVPQSISSDSI